MNIHEHIFLIGMPGSGKSGLGKRLANHFQVPFYDLDQIIEIESGMRIPVYFNHFGEDDFRKTEQRVLLQTITKAKGIISCGGGTPCFHNNITLMNAHGLCIYIYVPVGILSSRLQKSQNERPMLKSVAKEQYEEFLKQIEEKRKPYYEQGSIQINDTPKQPQSLYKQAIHVINEYFKNP